MTPWHLQRLFTYIATITDAALRAHIEEKIRRAATPEVQFEAVYHLNLSRAARVAGLALDDARFLVKVALPLQDRGTSRLAER